MGPIYADSGTATYIARGAEEQGSKGVPIAQFQRNRWDKNDEGELRFWSITPMSNPKSWIKALRITAAVLVMVAQVIVACLG